MLQHKSDIIRELERNILPLQGFTALPQHAAPIGLGSIEGAFPNHVFPSGAMHECISAIPEESAATASFIAGLTAKLMKNDGACVWVGTNRKVFPPALKAYGILPERVLFIDTQKEKDALWVMEEALKCEGLTAVIGEINNIDFKSSRRLQLATEQSRVTGFILRNNLKYQNTIACIARWKITPLLTNIQTPGVGFARWKVELLKVRNGRPGAWEVEWNKQRFRIIEPEKQPVWQTGTYAYGSAS